MTHAIQARKVCITGIRRPDGEILKIDAFYSELRIVEIPLGYHKYSIRGSDTDWSDTAIENKVYVNHNADILTKQNLGNLSEDCFIEIQKIEPSGAVSSLSKGLYN